LRVRVFDVSFGRICVHKYIYRTSIGVDFFLYKSFGANASCGSNTDTDTRGRDAIVTKPDPEKCTAGHTHYHPVCYQILSVLLVLK